MWIGRHPACREEDMAQLAVETKNLGLQLEQVQDFTPTPMTLATEIYYTGIHPYTLEKVYTARTEAQKQAQRNFFFWWKPEERDKVITELRKIHRSDLITQLYPSYRGYQHNRNKRNTTHILQKSVKRKK